MVKYQPSRVESKWQKQWREPGAYRIDLASSKKKFYLLIEFTYPSGDLHMGHWFAFAVPDILARMKRMQGYTVFAPNGFDAFGLPAENAAISRGVHPSDWTYGNIKRMKQQFATMGAIYDWAHEVITCDPEYYRWNQWIFLKMYEKGLAYRAKSMANWCPKDQCVLANENVENGRCWRCGSEVVQKAVEQWFLKITDYAEKLLWKDFSVARADWPQSLKEGQNNWIGKSAGTIIEFRVKSSKLKLKIEVFTTRADTLFGATFLVLAPEHKLVTELLSGKWKVESGKLKEIREYIKRSQKKSELERKEMKEKTGVFTGAYARNPINGREIPIWIADYALMDYGTGALFGDAHDERDVEFAKKYHIDLKPTLITGDPKQDSRIKNLEEVFTGEGILFDSGKFSGLTSAEAVKKITQELEKSGNGRAQVVYHLRDWSISRQRYWGTPIPVIYCANCWEVKSQPFDFAQGGKSKVKSVEGVDYAVIDGKEHTIVPVPYDQLPVELPYEVDFAPMGKSPLATAEEWVKVSCPSCGGDARREVETMDTFVDSSWYFLRYLRKVKSQPFDFAQGGKPKVKSENLPWDSELLKAWMPVDIYFGGAEHTLGHTLYSRFFVKFLQDIGVVPPMFEYAKKRIHHGVILGPDGARMSKSHGNVVNPDEEVKQYGADAMRMYLAFLGPYDLVAPWDPGGIRGVYHFLERVWKLADKVVNSKFEMVAFSDEKRNSKLSVEDAYWMHKTIKKVTEDIENIKFNTAIAALMEWLNYLSGKAHTANSSQQTAVSGKRPAVSRLEYEVLLKLLAPFAPHMTEELYQQFFGNSKFEIRNSKFQSIHLQPWPKYDPKLAQAKEITLVVQVNGKLRDRLPVEAGLSREEAEKLALGSERVQKYLGKKKPQRVIFVTDRLINFVI